MREIAVILPHGAAIPSIAGVEAAIARGGLRVTLVGTLAQYPGCTHWHLKRGRERGVLELTVWPQQRRVWLSVQDGRNGDWIDAAAQRLTSLLTKPSRSSAGRPTGSARTSATGRRRSSRRR